MTAVAENEPTVKDIVDKIAFKIGQEHYGTGPLAELRRMPVDGAITSSAFHLLMIDVFPDRRIDEYRLSRWALIVKLIALNTGVEGERLPFAKALIEADVSESRFVSFLEAREDMLVTTVLRLAKRLASARVNYQVSDLARYLLETLSDGESADRSRTRMAGQYYAAAHKEKAAKAAS